ncbi:hypothetical protein [Microbulbifer sp. TRSA007]|uniref:hypothetical protein n=1 Tax=unclassified Microbulbifer TaxID=2619833 RepID=UPI00403928E4
MFFDKINRRIQHIFVKLNTTETVGLFGASMSIKKYGGRLTIEASMGTKLQRRLIGEGVSE